MNDFLAKDFIQTPEGLIFAVVEQGLEQGKILCFLRYQLTDTGLTKLKTDAANQLLAREYPQYLFFSPRKAAHLHAVAVNDVQYHYQPKAVLQQLLNKKSPDLIEQDCIALCTLLAEKGFDLSAIGVTGSLLIEAQSSASDIDLVVYNREVFHQLRAVIEQCIAEGSLTHLDTNAWQDSYQRRECDLSFDAYVWHEQRKFNKALINGRKFDISLVNSGIDDAAIQYKKHSHQVLQLKVINADYAFDYPARFIVEHDEIDEVVCYTATYTGQAVVGEIIEVAGVLETTAATKRILVGSSREAIGEYIKVIR